MNNKKKQKKGERKKRKINLLNKEMILFVFFNEVIQFSFKSHKKSIGKKIFNFVQYFRLQVLL